MIGRQSLQLVHNAVSIQGSSKVSSSSSATVSSSGVDGSVVAGKVRESSDLSFGFNAQTEEYGDMIAAGIMDPTKVVRVALQDAASVASLLITTEAMIADKPSKDGGNAGGGMGDMGGMGGMM